MSSRIAVLLSSLDNLANDIRMLRGDIPYEGQISDLRGTARVNLEVVGNNLVHAAHMIDGGSRFVGSARSYERTAAELEHFDGVAPYLEAAIDACSETHEVHRLLKLIDDCGLRVARAFNQDTADVNRPGRCDRMRPGPAKPSPGFELSTIRKAVAEWKKVAK